MSHLNELSALNCRLGYVYFLAPEGSIAPEWQRYVERLSSISRRHNFKFEVLAAPSQRWNNATVSRLFNLGNIGRADAFAWISGEWGEVTTMASIEEFFDALLEVDYWLTGSREITSAQHDTWNLMSAPAPCSAATFEEDGLPAEPRPYRRRKVVATPPDVEEEAVKQVEWSREQLAAELTATIQRYVLQFNELPPMSSILQRAMKDILVPQLMTDTFSPVVINGNLDIVLPSYNELIIKLTPLAKCIYILFLMHPDGLKLKDIGDYREELVELYSLVKPGADEGLARESIYELCTPGSDSLNQKISMARRVIKAQLPVPEAFSHYTISGERGGAYRVEAARWNVTLPRVLERH